MSEWIDVTPESGFAPGAFTVVDVDDVMIAVFNLQGEYFAIEDLCTHDGGDLVGGCVRGDTIECPRHGAVFSIRTGEVLAPPAYEPVAIFPVRVSDGMIQVRDDRWD
jgi:3-phenylpropionate/trans-cinnamate dioxygenase ferredoxin subunit